MRFVHLPLMWTGLASVIGLSVGLSVLGFQTQGGLTTRQDDKAQKPVPGQGRHPLVGAWRVKSERIGGEDRAVPYIQYKIIADGRFMWSSYTKETGEIRRAAGGTYEIKGDKYIERLEYANAADLREMIGKELSFTWKIEDGRWRHSGTVPNGAVIDELWERAK